MDSAGIKKKDMVVWDDVCTITDRAGNLYC